MVLGQHHLHIAENDQIVDWLAKSLRSASKGIIKLDVGGKPTAKIEVNNNDNINGNNNNNNKGDNNNRIIVDLIQPSLFKTTNDETGLFDKLKTAKEFSHKLSENGVTISFLRKGNEAITLGKGAKPTVSKLITRSDDMQINSLKAATKLKRDLKAD
jgi:hypothetical protein